MAVRKTQQNWRTARIATGDLETVVGKPDLQVTQDPITHIYGHPEVDRTWGHDLQHPAGHYP